MKRNDILHIGLSLVILFITFFIVDVNAANFSYSEYNEEKWQEILKENKNFWTDQCEETDNSCIDKVLKSKEKYYKRLYELLAKAESIGHINDNYIIVTTFYGLNADTFNDPDIDRDYNPYNIDEDSDTKDKYIGDVDNDNADEAKEYFKKEKDTLKELVNAFIGYKATCYGETEDEVTSTGDEKSCPNDLSVIGNKCYKKLSNYKGTFWDAVGFLPTENKKNCKEMAKDYKGYKLDTSKKREVNVDYYWEYLKTSNYFDRKLHLKSYFQHILDDSGYKTMEELEKNDEVYEKFSDDIVDARENIINNIKSIIETYGDKFNTLSASSNLVSSTAYWWPIGGSEVTDGFAIGDPVSLNISSNFGKRVDPVTHKEGAMHRGVDISGEIGVTPVIAAQDGLVTLSAKGDTGTCVQGDKSCGGGYGNYITIQHNDGNYTLYAHMDTNSVLVKEGDNVKQGQVIGYVGSTGKSTGGHLHFEVRVGSQAKENAVDPLTYIKSSNPRVKASEISLVNGETNKETVCKTLTASNISNNGVAALMTNINSESSFNNNTVGDHGTSYGLCQWHNGRWDNLKNKYPDSWKNIDSQLQFLLDELNSGYATLYNSLIMGNDSAYQLTHDFCYYFERPSNKVTKCKQRAEGSNDFLTYVNNGCK